MAETASAMSNSVGEVTALPPSLHIPIQRADSSMDAARISKYVQPIQSGGG
jgi:hypothetical protein